MWIGSANDCDESEFHQDFVESEERRENGLCRCMIVFGHAVAAYDTLKTRRHCVGEDSDAVAHCTERCAVRT